MGAIKRLIVTPPTLIKLDEDHRDQYDEDALGPPHDREADGD